jgi:hypothetical protein
MVLLLQTPYVDVSKKPEGKSGMDNRLCERSDSIEQQNRKTNIVMEIQKNIPVFVVGSCCFSL